MSSQQIPVWACEVGPDFKLKLEAMVLFQQYVRSLVGQSLQLVLRKRGSKRSLVQNAWIWGVAYPVIAESLGYDHHEHEDLHYALVAKCFGEHFDKRIGAMVPNKRSSKMTTTEFSEYMEWLVRFAATELGGIMVPLPGESEAA